MVGWIESMIKKIMKGITSIYQNGNGTSGKQ